jgi:uncharacterized protein YciI
MKNFVIFRYPGSGWVKDTPTRQQPLWNEHAAFMDNLFDSGVILLAGPYADYSGVLLIVQVDDEAAAKDMLRDDPWTIHDILDAGSAKEWLIFLDSRAKQSG